MDDLMRKFFMYAIQELNQKVENLEAQLAGS